MNPIKTIYPLNEILPSISNEDYHASSPISSSNCKDLLISAWQYQYKQQNPIAPTPAMRFGTMFHSLVLEPKTFDDLYYVADIPKRNTKQGKADYNELMLEVGDKALISTDDFCQAQEMRHNLAKNGLVRALLSNGFAEQSIFWVDEHTMRVINLFDVFIIKIFDAFDINGFYFLVNFTEEAGKHSR